MKTTFFLALLVMTQVALASERPIEEMQYRTPAVLSSEELEHEGGHTARQVREVPRRPEVADRGRSFNCEEEPLIDDAHHQDSASAGAAEE